MIDWNNFESKLQERGRRAELSRQTGISTGNIRDWFNPDKNAQPSADALVKISNILFIIIVLAITAILIYITSKSFTKKIKSFDLKIGKNEWIKIHNEFYK